MRAKALLAALILPVLCPLATAPALAATCQELRADLLRAPEVTGNSAEVRRVTGALSRQNAEIRELRSALRRYDCSVGSIIVVGSEANPTCIAIQARLDTAEQQRDRLEGERGSLGAGVVNGSQERRQILAALQEKNCDFTASIQSVSLVSTAPVPATANGDSEFYTRIPAPEGEAPSPDPLTQPMPGTLRTMCVRTCDGAFFPISANASRSDFPRDAAICTRMCPGAQTSLYYHTMENAESTDMVSAADNRPYRDLPGAFAYTNRLPGEKPACGCGANSAGFSPLGEEAEEPAKPLLRPSTSVPPPVIRERPYDPEQSKVRVIGPQFLPQETHLNRDLDKDLDAEGKIR